jgi:hypothetical protein
VNIQHHRTALTACAAAIAALVAACNDDPENPPPPPPAAATTLQGVAALGAPFAGATVTVVDSDAATADPAPVTADAQGRYSIDVSALKAPLTLKASGNFQGGPTELVSVLPSVTAESANTANVTPLTHAVAALVAPGGDPLALTTPATLAANGTAEKVGNAATLLVNTLATDPAIRAALGSAFDPMRTAFTANGSGVDGVLDQLAVDVSAAGVTLTNLAAPVTGDVPATVTLTPAQTATPTVVPTLPPSAPAGNLPTAAELAALGAKFEACLAIPATQRVTLDGSGTVTAVAAACNYAPADWRSNGRNWLQEVGQFTLTKAYFDGAKVGPGQVVLALAPAGHTDPKVFKAPYCNDGPCAVVRWPLVTAGGAVAASEWVVGKTASGWDIVGNQRPYRVFIEPRLNRKIAANRDGAAPGNTADPFFFKDRYESILRLIFDPSVGNTANIRAVRYSGPGLPAGGVVAYRSQRCGADDRFAIVNQTGSTRVLGTTTFQFWTGGTSAEFVLDAANLDGSPLALPAPNTATGAFPDFAPTPVANQSTTAPAWSVYKVELFHFDVLSDEPAEIVYLRTVAAAENAALGATKTWPTLAPAAVTDYLTPTGAKAGAIGDLAQTLSWTGLANGFVGSAYLFTQNFAQATNGQGETATYGARARLDFDPLALGDLSARGIGWASAQSGTSLSSFTANVGTNPNPRCGSTDLLPLTTSVSDYRELGLTFRGPDRKLYNAIWFWDN